VSAGWSFGDDTPIAAGDPLGAQSEIPRSAVHDDRPTRVMARVAFVPPFSLCRTGRVS
jgi:hypothetical protein